MLHLPVPGPGFRRDHGSLISEMGKKPFDILHREFVRKHTYNAAGSYKVELKSGAFGGRRPSILKIVGALSSPSGEATYGGFVGCRAGETECARISMMAKSFSDSAERALLL